MLPDAYSELMSITDENGDYVWIPHTDDVKASDTGAQEVNASYFNYPNVFEIFFDGPLGSKIDGFLPAVCTNAQVDYTGGQKFSTFADGQPVHIQLTLNFLEIKTMTLGNYEAIRAGGVGKLDDQSMVDRQSENVMAERATAYEAKNKEKQGSP
jgi:hypothetical protein